MNASWSIEPQDGGTDVMAVRGELDIECERPLVDAVDELLLERPGASLVVDLSAVEFIDSSGVRALLLLRQLHGGRVRVGQISDPVARVLDIAGLTGRLVGDGEKAT